MRKLTLALHGANFMFSRSAILIWFCVMAINVQSWSQCTPESNTISGTIFEDATNDGAFRSTEVGLGNILVTAYDVLGNSVGTAISDEDGHYTIANLLDDTSYRLEFQSSSSYYSGFQGEDNRSSVQFINAPACEVDYGLTRAVSSCGTNPDLILTCFVQGEISENPGFETIISTEHNFGVSSSVVALATASETGSIWGLAQDVIGQNLYTSAFVKQYAGLKFGPYAILKTELEGDKKTTLFADVNSLIPQALPGLTVTDVHDCTYGNQVGRVGLGGIIISPDSRILYTSVLDENLVVSIDIDDPSSSGTKVYEMPRPVGIDNAEEYRIFAMKWHEDLIYIGGTVTGSVSQDKSKSMGVVMTLDPETGEIEEIFRTEFLKGYWQDELPESLSVSHWFTDIDFTSTGEMILSLTDRIGHRYCKASTNRLDQQFPDVLLAALNPNTGEWELENNGMIAGRSGSGVDNGDGPGGGEFFGFDNWPTNPTYHNETALGSVFVLPGSDEVVVSVYDPLINSYSGGLHRYSTIDGSKNGAIELYTHSIFPVFGKATGFGDIIAKCDAQTIEIGNYVWNDDNGNGLQDANEDGIAGITLNLYDDECNLVGTTTTDEYGVYAFNSSNVDSDQNGSFDGVYPNTLYYVELDNTLYDDDSGLYTFGNEEYTICTANAGNDADDLIDCDAEYDASVCLESSFIAVNTGETNHSFDIALGTPSGFDLALRKEIIGNKFAIVGEELMFMITIFNQGGVSASSVTITDYIPDGYIFEQESNPDWSVDDNKLSTTITQKILPGTTVSKTLKLVVSGSQAAGYTNVAEISEALNLAGDKAQDTDSTPDAIQSNDNGGEPFTNTDDQINDGGELDEDDHDPATPSIFDLAVRIKLNDDKYYYGGDLVKFDIELYNQGNTDADLIKLANYAPKELKFNSELSTGWIEEDKFITLTDENILAAGEKRDYCVYFNVEDINKLDELVNYIEISESSPVGNSGSFDFDSTPDVSNENDTGGEIYTSNDNMIDDHGIIDEDDHDPVVIKTQYVDLALMKTTSQTRVKAGDIVTFDIEVLNQGSVPAHEVTIIDYMPQYLTLVDDNWTLNNSGHAVRTLVLDNPLTKGNKVSTTISAKVSDDVTPQAIVNFAEVLDVKDVDNLAVGNRDIDSTPDDTQSNDIGGVPDSDTDNTVNSSKDIDEDDHDPARIVVISSELESSECLANATNSTDGQYEDVFTVTGPSGDVWYVQDQINYYDINSPEPGMGTLITQETGVGVLLTETAIVPDNGMSTYSISVIRQDGDAGYLVLRSEDDEVETFNVLAESYPDIFISGNLALCDGGSEEYCVLNPDPNVTYMWEQNAGAIVTSQNPNNTCVVIDWSNAAPNASYDLSVTPDDGCYAPASYGVSIGSSSGAMSCLGNVNLSLNSDCEIVINPNIILTSPILSGQAYNVMLTTQSGEVIPNATITAEHLGTTVTAKIIDACSGNSCWSEIYIEDKLAPSIVCNDVTVSCNKIDEFGGPFAEDNCGTIESVDMLSSVLTTLDCNDPDSDLYVAVIDRQYQATDAQGNKSEVCDMKMYVERVNLDDIIWPDTFLMLNNTALNCNEYDLDMDGVADLDITGVPVYNNEYVYPDFGALCSASITFEDEKRVINGVIKITRTWTAWEWHCNDAQTKVVEQLIEIRDTEAPTIVCPSNIDVSAVTGNCSGTVTLPAPQIDDSCSPDGLTYTIKPPFGALIKEGDSRVVTFPYSEIPYDVVYTAIDGAGLSTTCIIQVTVNDDIAPVAICDQNTIVGLNSNGIGYAYALNIDDGSYDACGVQSIEIRRMDEGGAFGDRAIFTCADLDAPVVVELMVTDNAGLTNTCMANVIVQDKHAPEVTGPDDLVINCGDNFLPLSQFGEFTFTDACEVDTNTVSNINLNSCGVGTITRTFTASDSDGSASVTQTITVLNNNPFDFHSVEFPRDTVIEISTCDIDGITDPDNLPDGYNRPVYDSNFACEMVSASPHDEMFSLFDDQNSVCFKIVRTWTVIDWCQLDEDGVPLEIRDVQVISVISTVVPDDIVVTGLEDPIVATTCDSAIVTFTATSGDCVDNNLQSLIQIDLDSDFNTTNTYEISIGGAGASATFSQMLPMGNHTAVVTFMNPCNQMTTTSFPINIINNIPPSIGCKNVAIGLEPWDLDGIPGPDTEAACITVDSLALASATFHLCGVDFELSFEEDAIVKELCFDCNDLGVQEVEIFAIDINGNVSSCVSLVDVQDNNDTDICMDVKDCVTFLSDTTVTLQQACEFQVINSEFDAVQNIADCGPLTITHDYTSLSSSTLFGAEFPLGETIVTWTITNGTMIETCQLTITVIDEIDPTITCASDITISSDGFTGCTYTHIGTDLDPTFADNCIDVDLTHNYTAPSSSSLDGATFPIGTTTVVFTVEDGSGNSSTCEIDITVDDNEGPGINCIDDITFNDTQDGNPSCSHTMSGTGLDAIAEDECGTVVSIVHDYNSAPSSSTLDGATFPLGTTTVVFTATDDEGNTSTCDVAITVVDDIAPSIICAASVTVDAGVFGDCIYVQNDEALDPIGTLENCEMNYTLTHDYTNAVDNTTLEGATFALGVHEITWTILDDAGLSNECTVTVTVIDNTAPECVDQGGIIDVTIGGDLTYVLSTTDLNVQYSDPCSEVTVTFSPATLDCSQEGIVDVVATVTDASNNSSECEIQFNVIADVEVSCALNISTVTLDANGAATIDPDAVVDIIGGGCGITYVPTLDITTFSCADIDSNPIEVTISLNGEECTTANIVVVDDIDPTISCIGDQSFNDSADALDDCQFTVTGIALDPTTFDGCGIETLVNDYTNTNTLDGAVFPVGTTNVLFTVTDNNGNTNTCTFAITVVDDITPIVSCADDIIVETSGTDCNYVQTDDSLDPVSMQENCGVESIVHDYAGTGDNTTLSGAIFEAGTHVIVWTITDDAGQSSTCTVTVTVVDPAPICVDQGVIDIDVAVGQVITITEDLLTAPFTDNCAVTSIVFEPSTISCENSGTLNVTATVSDAAGNSSECPVVFNVIVDEEISCTFNVDTVYLNIDGVFNLDPSIVDVTGGTCGGTQTVTFNNTFASCNDVAQNPFEVEIFVNGNSCGIDSFIVLDTIAPIIACQDYEISCSDFDASFTNIADYIETIDIPGTDEVEDNCKSSLIFTSTVDSSGVNECNYGTVLRTVTVEDPLSGTSDSCVETFTINGPADPLTQADIDGIIPSTVTTTGCTGEGSPDVTEITIEDLDALVDCGQFTVDFMDVSISEGCPDTINRTYTIEAICQSETFMFIQEIIVIDDEAPSFVELSDTTIVANPNNCMALVDLSGFVVATDNCSVAEDVEVTYAFDENGSFNIEDSNILEAGEYTITVTATDICENITIDSFELMVVDTSELVVSCAKLIVYLDTITAMVDVSPFQSLIVSGNCDNAQNIIASWDPVDFNDTIITYDCDDISEPVIDIMYIFEVIGNDTIPFDISPDVDGVNNDCKVETEVRDSTNVCANTIFEIQGDVTTVEGNGISNYRMTLHGSNTDAVLSEEDGSYNFPMMPEGGNYSIGTYKNDDVMNGVSTLDLILIQRHILGIAEFDSPYKLIASDINNNEKVNGSDLLALRKVILGIDIEFDNNLSWRTIDQNHIFEDPTDPWASSIPESYDVIGLSTHMYVDFYGVKIGDVNGSATFNLTNENVVTRTENVKTLISEYDVDQMKIITEEDVKVAGIQFTINTGLNKISNITSEVFNDSNIGFYEVEEGVYNISIANSKAIELEEGEELINITYDCMDCNLGAVSLSNNGISNELYINDDFEAVNIELVTRDENQTITAFSVAQNSPNPWSSVTDIDVTLTKDSDVEIRVFNVTGGLVYNETLSLNVGRNTIQLDDDKVNGAGVFYYEISTETESAQYKMIKLK